MYRYIHLSVVPMKVGGDPGVVITGLCEQLGVDGEESCVYPEPLSYLFSSV